MEDTIEFFPYLFDEFWFFYIFLKEFFLWIEGLNDLLHEYLSEALVKLGWEEKGVD